MTSPRSLIVGTIATVGFILAVAATNTIGLVVGAWLTRMFVP